MYCDDTPVQPLPLSKSLRAEYEASCKAIEKEIAELYARRLSGDDSEATKRRLRALECKLQSVQDRLDNTKRKNRYDIDVVVAK